MIRLKFDQFVLIIVYSSIIKMKLNLSHKRLELSRLFTQLKYLLRIVLISTNIILPYSALILDKTCLLVLFS